MLKNDYGYTGTTYLNLLKFIEYEILKIWQSHYHYYNFLQLGLHVFSKYNVRTTAKNTQFITLNFVK